ncbi:MAG: hypothetical protein ACK5LC_18090, partial [Coprobacillaceae bacterium]
VDGSCELGISAMLGLNMWSENTATDIFPALQAYQKINNIEVSTKDMTLNPYFGIQLENQQWTKLGSKDMLEGQLSNDKGVVIQLAAVKDLAHWNYKPEAEYIWNFFKNYQRDIETKELIIGNKEEPTKPGDDDDKPTDNNEEHIIQDVKPTSSSKLVKTNDISNTSSIMMFIISAGLLYMISKKGYN